MEAASVGSELSLKSLANKLCPNEGCSLGFTELFAAIDG